MPARYDLAKVKGLASAALSDPTKDTVYFSARSKSIDRVIEEFQLKGKPMDPLKAEVYILESILKLEQKDFVGTYSQWANDYADWYGIFQDGIPWYVKFLVDNDPVKQTEFLEQISFHRSDRDMKLENGKTIKLNGSIV